MGPTTELYETPKHPVVVARNAHIAGRRTVLIYGHYDVQPVDPLELWTTPPFEPVIRDGKIWARGATDNKGQMLAHVLGVEKTLREQGELPLNLIFLFEGEEEIGSPNLAAFLRDHRDELRCDVVAISDIGMVAPGVPTLGYIERGERARIQGLTCEHPPVEVKRFREKPDAELAEQFIAQGNFSWNAGMFVWSLPTVIEQLTKHAPQLSHFVSEIRCSRDITATVAAQFPRLTPISIDYCLMEKADRVLNIEATFDWDDGINFPKSFLSARTRKILTVFWWESRSGNA